jgi:hypothetical protein
MQEINQFQTSIYHLRVFYTQLGCSGVFGVVVLIWLPARDKSRSYCAVAWKELAIVMWLNLFAPQQRSKR